MRSPPAEQESKSGPLFLRVELHARGLGGFCKRGDLSLSEEERVEILRTSVDSEIAIARLNLLETWKADILKKEGKVTGEINGI